MTSKGLLKCSVNEADLTDVMHLSSEDWQHG